MTLSLFDRIGGQRAVNATVDNFYRKVTLDDRVNHFFIGVDMAPWADNLKAYLTGLFGGPDLYTGRSMREAHKGLVGRGLNDTHVDVMTELLTVTLAELGIVSPELDEVLVLIEKNRHDVLNR